MKKFLSGLIVGAVLLSGMSVWGSDAAKIALNAVKIAVNGKAAEAKTLQYNGENYIKAEDAAKVFGASYSYDDKTNTVNYKQDTFTVTLDSYEPKAGETINLMASRPGFEGMSYKAIAYYSTKSTEYEGKVGTLCPIDTGRPKKGYKVGVHRRFGVYNRVECITKGSD